jgi:uncharacterized membrane protein
MIPLMLELDIKRKDQKGRGSFDLWLPLFLIWLIALPPILLLTPLILLAALILWPTGKGRYILFLYLVIFGLIWHMSGIKIDIQSNKKIVYLNLI